MNYCSEFAALTTFRKIVNANKNLYDLIDDFLIFSIIFNEYRSFDAEQIVSDINDEFNFQIPVSIIRDAIKRLRTKKYISLDQTGGYLNELPREVIKEYEQTIKEYADEKEENKTNNRELINYVKDKINNKPVDDLQILKVFRSLILGNNDYLSEDVDIVHYVGTFIIKKNEENSIPSESWELIKSSIIIREALLYNADILAEKFKNLGIYLDMEILFDGFGFNGSIYKQLYDDFKSLVNELNNHGCNISLLYFDHTNNDIEYYFQKALEIFDNRSSMWPETTAMQNILSNCRDRSSIIEKKAEFFQYIKSNDITMVSSNRLDEETKTIKMNKINDNDYGNDYIYRMSKSILPITYIKILRHSQRTIKLTDTSFIFATRTKIFLNYALEDRKTTNEIPLAVDTDYLISKLWVATGRGFGADKTPNSAVSFVQRVLSNEKRREISQEYKRLLENKDNIDEPNLQIKIAALRQVKSAPENITSISFDVGIDKEIQNLIDAKETLTLEKVKSEKLKKSLEKQMHLQELQEKKNESLNKKIQGQLDKLTVELSQKMQEKERLDIDAKGSTKKIQIIYKTFGIIVIILLSVLIIIFMPKNWQTVAPWTWIIPFICVLFSTYLGAAFFTKKFDLRKIIIKIDNSIQDQCLAKIYKKNNLDLNRIEEIKKEIEYFTKQD